MKESSMYEYEINLEDKNSTVVKQRNFIGINKKVLEFGCSTGYISRILKEKGCAIIGIEIDEEASKKAAAYCERVIIGDIETIDYNKQLGNEKFDVALFGDILEHLKDPKTILLKVKDFLKEKGYIVISIPNVAHWSVRLDLTCGKFDYQDSGILDDTHLRFFTKSSIINLLESCGYYVTYMDEVRQEVDWNKVGTVMRLKNLNDADLKNFSSFLNDREAGVFQYVLKAVPSSDPEYLKKISAEKISLEERIQNFEGQITAFSGQLTDKERQINALTATIQGNDEQIRILDGQIANISGQLREKDKQIEELDVTIRESDEQISDLESQITDFSGQLKEKERQINELHIAAQGKDEQLRYFEGQITDFSGQLKEKERQINELHIAAQGKDEQLRYFEGQITDFSGQLKEKEERIREFEMDNLRINNELNSMKSSVTWRAVMKWHSLVEWLLPPGTRRRGWYDLSVIGLRTIANDGWKSFWWSYKQHRATKMSFQSTAKSAPIVSQPLATPSKVLDEKVDIINKKVSIVIPTKNAGSDFEFTLERLKTQKGIEEIELVIVDSGSRDETVKLAEKYGASSYSIRPEEFNHGLTRNYGAEQATGDYFLFMVQDAIPIGNYWLYDMVNVLEKDPQIAAATCRQVPRSDADLFACFSLWTHYHSLLNFQGYRTAEPPADFDNLPAYEKRQLCGLDNVATIVRSDVFAQLKFSEIRYAEDLDLGARLLKAGYKLAFLHSVGVVHTHNRDASYILRRYYVDTKIQQGLFNYKEYDLDINFDALIYSILVMYSALNLSVEALKVSLHRTSDANRYINAIMKLEGLIQENVKVAEIRFDGDPLLNDLFHKINEVVKVRGTDKGLMKLLVSRYLTFLNMLKEFVMIHSSNEEELIDTLYKLFSSVIATVFACSLPEYEDNRAHMLERLLEVDV